MPPRAIASGTISFGLVSIPVKLYTATSPQKVSFNMLEKGTGARLKQQYISSATGQVVERDQVIKGYEFARGQYVHFTEEEIKALETATNGAFEIAEFVPMESVDFLQVEKSYYLGPDKGGDKAYQLLSKAMTRKGQVAVARWAARGKDQLVIIRPYRRGLLLHQMFYADEVRPFDEIEPGSELNFADVELDLAERLIDQLGKEGFDASKYRDNYTDRVRKLVDEKVAGHEVTIVPEQPQAQIIDLFEALKQSLSAVSAQPADSPAPLSEPKPMKKATPKAARAKKASAS
jgi:DNA end-binding protein Ku